MTIGRKIIELRKKENLTQDILAHKIGITRQTLSNWESDITSPDLKAAQKIASIFKISLDDLTDHHIDITCQKEHHILETLVGQNAYIEILEEDYRIDDYTICKIVSLLDHFLKIEFQYGKETITKLIDIDLISTIRIEVEK